jgi:hypothetical protein
MRKQQRAQVLTRGETARRNVRPVLLHQSVEGRPGDEFQDIVKDAIPVPHGIDPFVSR